MLLIQYAIYYLLALIIRKLQAPKSPENPVCTSTQQQTMGGFIYLFFVILFLIALNRSSLAKTLDKLLNIVLSCKTKRGQRVPSSGQRCEHVLQCKILIKDTNTT